jgi:hypothetical protein
MDKLKDIKDLDPISIWPLAYGYWIIIMLIAMIIGLKLFMDYRQDKFKNSWRFKAALKLQSLRNSSDNSKIIASLFELLKEVSIQKFGRKQCANLTGQEWLKWLNNNDKHDWISNGKRLIEIQYAPDHKVVEALQEDNVKKDIDKILDGISSLIKN